jgi:hypothetical protein
VVLGSAIAVSLAGGGLMAMPAAAQDDCGVAIYGGDVLNQTVIDLNANGGTAIADASGGFGNEATTGGRNVDDVDIASAGNGGVATSSANGGAVSVGDINSGGNVCNAIGVGDTWGGPVAVDGGTVANSTTLGISANGGTAIADASGGDYNLAFVS